MAKLNLYVAASSEEFLAIVTKDEFAEECKERGLALTESVELEGDFISWPTDRLLAQV